jgi:hypothetical protein
MQVIILEQIMIIIIIHKKRELKQYHKVFQKLKLSFLKKKILKGIVLEKILIMKIISKGIVLKEILTMMIISKE